MSSAQKFTYLKIHIFYKKRHFNEHGDHADMKSHGHHAEIHIKVIAKAGQWPD